VADTRPPGLYRSPYPDTPAGQLARIDDILRENGFEYPLGWRGVQDMATQLAACQEVRRG
jgi:hypothetical protein